MKLSYIHLKFLLWEKLNKRDIYLYMYILPEKKTFVFFVFVCLL